MRHLPLIAVVACALTLSACTSARKTTPKESATEQLLVSRAVDEAAEQISLSIPDDTAVHLDTSGVMGEHAKYAEAALRERVLELGANLASKPADAEMIVEVRAGALSIDEYKTLVGVPSFDVPVPLAGKVTTPELALYKRDERRGIAKFAATAYTAEEGEFVDSTNARYGFSHKRKWTVLLAASWSNDDLIPPGKEPSLNSIQKPN